MNFKLNNPKTGKAEDMSTETLSDLNAELMEKLNEIQELCDRYKLSLMYGVHGNGIKVGSGWILDRKMGNNIYGENGEEMREYLSKTLWNLNTCIENSTAGHFKIALSKNVSDNP